MQYTGTITATGQQVLIDLPTARVPELPQITLPVNHADLIPIHVTALNKLFWITASDLRDYMITGGNTTPIPVVQGNVVEIPISASMAGTNRVNVPALQNKTFLLFRRGISGGQLAVSEFLNLPSGGFELSDPTDVVQDGELFFAHVFQMAAATPGGGGNTTSTGGFLDDIALITGDITLSSIHKKKLIHIAGGSSKVTVTLPDITNYQDEIFVIETIVGNSFQSTVTTTGGQSIYLGNTSDTKVVLGQSEFLWVMAGTNGWYTIKASESILNVGQPLFDYVERLNTKKAVGQVANKADYPRLWNWLQNNSSLVVSQIAWQDTKINAGTDGVDDWVYPLRGKFADIDATTFRFPDLLDMAHVAIKNIGGVDAERTPNETGVIQKDMVRKHRHFERPDEEPQHDVGLNAGSGPARFEEGSFHPITKKFTGYNQFPGSKTVPKNVGLLPLIRI